MFSNNNNKKIIRYITIYLPVAILKILKKVQMMKMISEI